MKVLVTGANGFVGSAVVRRLLGQQFTVRALVRPGSESGNLPLADIECVTGDLRDAASLRAALRGCTAVFHVAADYRLWVPDPETMYDINVRGTERLLEAALEQHIERIVYTSSVATLGHTADGSPADERTPVHIDDMIGHYKRSKYLAEEAVHRMVGERDCPVVIVNPSTPIGPGDIKPTPTGRIIRDALLGRMPAYVDSGLNIVHVDDVAAGHIAALRHGRIGRRYVLGGDNLSLQSLLAGIAGFAGRRPPRLRIPHNVAMGAAWLAETWARLSGATPGITRDGVRLSRRKMYFSSARAERELGYSARPAHHAIEDAVHWWLERLAMNQ